MFSNLFNISAFALWCHKTLILFVITLIVKGKYFLSYYTIIPKAVYTGPQRVASVLMVILEHWKKLPPV